MKSLRTTLHCITVTACVVSTMCLIAGENEAYARPPQISHGQPSVHVSGSQGGDRGQLVPVTAMCNPDGSVSSWDSSYNAWDTRSSRAAQPGDRVLNQVFVVTEEGQPSFFATYGKDGRMVRVPLAVLPTNSRPTPSTAACPTKERGFFENLTVAQVKHIAPVPAGLGVLANGLTHVLEQKGYSTKTSVGAGLLAGIAGDTLKHVHANMQNGTTVVNPSALLFDYAVTGAAYSVTYGAKKVLPKAVAYLWSKKEGKKKS